MVAARCFAFLAFYLVSNSAALPIRRAPRIREVPQEHSHERILRAANVALKLNNPDNIQDAVFGLLGNAAAAAGAGKITDLDCLQTATADRAFTNAKAAGDVAAMTAALQYRALERNTGKVGLESVQCTSFTPVNPEVAAITQHQDPAATGAAAKNKAIVLALAKQIASIGGDPQTALETGTFQAGDVNDATAKGNTCDDPDDAQGCIISQNLIVFDATADEITAAVGDANTGTDCTAVPVTITVTASSDPTPTSTSTSTPAPAATSTPEATSAPAPAPVITTTSSTPVAITTQTADKNPPASSTSTSTPAPATTTTATAPNGSNNGGNTGGNNNTGGGDQSNLQAFSESLGDVAAPKVTASGNQFLVEGNSSFNNLRSALVRSCDVQNNKCADKSNAAGQSKTFSVADCNAQQVKCIAQANAAASK
ncbi:hypothetical protein RSOLAG22IIIB_01727 [Rhizoctonia solani]|uniref:Uncharacterized protein n=1 Tax=Rhizoctonia solani TaxID=456999 RepID=A0A0K6G9D5_9AGAM|nr:unnamed protein product [Rhizoctonia solani]CUA75086.1 hypothetical protein RSOLAG22IIIB_01727 [Rhizoctonia solani]